jgi:CDP-diacylglycerol--glycerol-3-phosphate 3-phosphatidyltransferase
MTSVFGPTAWATPANAVTVARLLIAPMLFAAITDGPAWWIFVSWVVLCFSDGIDGWLARRMGTTRSGAFLDPLADKVLVLGGMFALVRYGAFWWLPVGLIAARELLISLYRTVAARQGITVPASRLAKWKTFTQQFAVGLVLLPPLADRVTWPAVVTLWFAVGLTLVTGAQYMLTARQRAVAQQVI